MRRALLCATLSFLTLNTTNLNASEVIGYYSKGSLKDGESILDKGIKIHKLFLARKKFYTSDQMNDVISDMADFVRQEYPDAETLQLGDLSAVKGGSAQGHGSHQNGLDADLVYLTKNNKLQSPAANFWQEEFVKSGKITSNFHAERNLELFKYLVMNHPVQRIFVDKIIKRTLCQYVTANKLTKDVTIQETLRRLRPEPLHGNHFHMRLRCPTTDYKCVKQAEVPKGNGCSSV
jgi:penicillin-insensitive murein endopeptidase